MDDEYEERRLRRLAWGALSIAVVATFVWTIWHLPGEIQMAGPALRAGDMPTAMGMLSGSAFVTAIVAWAFLYFAATRRWAPGRGPLFFFILLFVATATNIGATLLAKSIAEKRNAEQQAQMATANAEMKSTFAAIRANPNGAVIDRHVKAQGDAGIIEGASKQYLATALKDRQDYKAELATTGFPGFLKPANLAAHDGLASARAKLALCHKIVKTYDDLSARRVSEYLAAIQASQLPEQGKRQVIAGINTGLARAEPIRQRFWSLEDSILTDFEQAVGVLARSKGRWTVSGGKFRFSNNGDLEAFNAPMRDVQSLAAEQKTLQSNALQTAN